MPLANLKAAASLGIGSALMLSTTGWRSTAIVFIAADSDFHHKDNRAGRSDFLKPRRTRRTNHRAREALDRIHRINKIDSETFCSFCPKNSSSLFYVVKRGCSFVVKKFLRTSLRNFRIRIVKGKLIFTAEDAEDTED